MSENTTIQTLQVNIQANSEQAEKRIEDTRRSLEQLRKESENSSEWKKNAIPVDFKVHENHNADFGTSFKDADTSFAEKLRNALSSIKDIFIDIGDSAAAFFSLTRDKMEPLVSLTRSLGNAFVSLGRVAISAFQGIVNLGRRVDATLLSATGRVADFFKRLHDERKKKTTEKISKMFGYLGNVIKRVFTFAVVRTFFRSIVSGFNEGMQNLYQYSRLTGTVFYANLDKLASYALFVKNAIGAMAAPIINVLTPAVTELMYRFGQLANTVGLFFAKLTGQSQFSAAILHMKQFEEAAKSAKRQVFGFDELNILNADNGNDTNYGAQFVEVDVEHTELPDFAEELKNRIQDSDWAGVGELLAEKVNEIFFKIDASNIGTKIGEKINNAIEFVHDFVSNLDFSSIGELIGNHLNDSLSEISTDSVGEILSNYVTGIFDLIKGFIETTDWKQVGTKVNDFLVGALNGIVTWAEGTDWNKLAQDVYGAIKDVITSIDYKQLAHDVFTLLGFALGATANIFEQAFKDIGQWFDETFENGIIDGLAKIGEWIKDNILIPFVGAFAKAFGLGDEDSDLTELGTSIVDSILSGIKQAWQSLTSWWDRNIAPWVEKAKSIWEDTKAIFANNSTNKADRYSNSGSSIVGKASGGTVPPGDLFWANERGPELIGQFGGRTEVYNQGTFASALASAMQPVIAATYDIGSQISNTVENKDTSTVVRIGDRDIYTAAQRGAQLSGRSLIQGAR